MWQQECKTNVSFHNRLWLQTCFPLRSPKWTWSVESNQPHWNWKLTYSQTSHFLDSSGSAQKWSQGRGMGLGKLQETCYSDYSKSCNSGITPRHCYINKMGWCLKWTCFISGKWISSNPWSKNGIKWINKQCTAPKMAGRQNFSPYKNVH